MTDDIKEHRRRGEVMFTGYQATNYNEEFWTRDLEKVGFTKTTNEMVLPVRVTSEWV
jgi:hypothetical protein